MSSSRLTHAVQCLFLLPCRKADVYSSSACRRAFWRPVLWAGVMVFLTLAYYQSRKPHANAVTQFTLTCAIVEHGTLRLDAYQGRDEFGTCDIAFYNGHYYSDKSPVTSFLGVPILFAYRWLNGLTGGEMKYGAARYWITLLAVGLSAALFAMLLTVLLIRRGVDPVWAALASALWIVATPLLGSAIHFVNYLPPSAMAAGGVLLVEDAWRGPRCPSRMRLFAGGVLLGLAAWALNTFAVVALGLTLLVAMGPAQEQCASGRMADVWRRLWPWAVGGVLGASGYFLYVYAIFGKIDSPYHYEVYPLFHEYMGRGLMGATWPPRPLVMWLITFHPFQGLLLWFPFVTLAMLGHFRRIWRDPSPARRESAVILLILAVLIVYISAYYMWWGGYCYAPRHLNPALALLGLGFVPWLTARSEKPARWLFVVGLVAAIINSAAAAVDSQPAPGLLENVLLHPEAIKHWPSPFLMLQRLFWIENISDDNMGMALKLYGRLSLVPLWIFWLAGWRWLARRSSRVEPLASLGQGPASAEGARKP